MRNLISGTLILILFASAQSGEAANKKRSNAKAAAPATSTNSAAHQQLARALDLAGKGQYQLAASQLFTLSRRSELQNDRPQIKYILGLMLMEMKMSQVAAFQFVDVIRMDNTKYKKQAIEKLSIVAESVLFCSSSAKPLLNKA